MNIIDLFWKNFGVMLIDGGVGIQFTWTFLFLALFVVFFIKYIKNKVKKEKG